MRLFLLGPFTATLGSRPIVASRTKATQALLVYLACRPEQPHRREHLMALLWPGLPQKSAQANLRQTLYQLRQAISELPARDGGGPVPFLLSDRQTIQVNPEAACEVDVLAFESLLQEGEARRAEAVDLYRDDFLADFYLPDSAAFEEWALARRQELRRQALEALEGMADRAGQEGDYGQAAAYARRQLAIDDLRESAYRQLMEALARSGLRSDALAQYETCRRLLRDELGVEPSPQTRVLYERLARGEVPEGAAAPGEPDARGQISTLERPRHNLPMQLSSFIGRERELAEVRRLLSASRLVTLTGAGGCGKTRLALQAAAGILDAFADGVWFVELAPLADPALVPQAVAAALDLQEMGERPPLELLLAYLRPRQLLLVLDNCEHLVEAAAQLAGALLRHCSHLRVLATSRETLNITGEAAWVVPSLSLPEPHEQPSLEALRRSDVIRLFTERAAAVLPTFALTSENAAAVEQVCRRLDGMPLAIELAAARAKMLRVEQIAARLDDRFHLLVGGSRAALPQHQTLEALIDWSYDLLAPAEQRLLRHLSVFAGGFTLEAVEAVCGRMDEGHALELLAQLVNKSLVVAEREPGDEARYHLLETIRQYALEKLAEASEAGPARDRHLGFFLQLAETAELRLQTGEQLVWLDRLKVEHDNLQAALAWSLEDQDGHLESGLRLAAALVEFWAKRSLFSEGRRWLDAALEKRDGASPAVRARLLATAGRLWLLQVLDDPTALVEEALALYRQLADIRGMAWSLFELGWCFNASGDLVAAASLWAESLALAGEADDRYLQATIYYALTWPAMARGEHRQADDYCAAGLALAQETGDREVTAQLLLGRARNARLQRDYDQAALSYLEALALARELKTRRFEAMILIGLGDLARCQRAYERAALFCNESLALARELDFRIDCATALHNLGLVAFSLGNRPDARAYFHDSMAIAVESSFHGVIGWNVWGLGMIAAAEGQMQRAARLFAAWEMRQERYANPPDPPDQEDMERQLARVRAELGEEVFAAAWAEGEALTVEESIDLALRD